MSEALLSLASDRGLPANTLVSGGLIELARRHGLVGVLAGETKNPVVTAVQSRQQVRQTVMLRHLNRLLDELDAAGIRAAVVKGPAVAQAYAVRSQRPFSDIDILVEDDRLEDAIEVLASDEAIVEIPEKRPKAAKRDVVIGDRSGIRFNVDLHWDLFSYTQLRGMADGAMADAWAEAAFSPDDELGPRWELPEHHTVCFLSAHAVLDHRFRLILFRDLLEVTRHGLDWAAIEASAIRWGLASTTYLALWMARGAVGASVPSDFLTSLRPRSTALSYLERAIPQLDLARFDGHTPHPVNLASVFLNDSLRHRLSLVVRAPAAFPGWRKRVADEEEEDQIAPPRTLIVVSTDRRRGAEVFTERLRDGLMNRGWVVEAVSLRGSGKHPRADVEVLTSDETASGRRFELAVVRALRKKIRSYRPDLVIANGGATLRYSIVAKLGMGADLAYIGIGEPQYWIRSRVSRWANRLMLRRADKVIAVSETTRRQLVALEPAIEKKSHTLFTGLDASLTEMDRPDSSGSLRVVMVGSLTTEKDPFLALRAVAAVDEAHIRFVGDGPLAEGLATEARRIGMGSRVEFVGSVDDVRPHLAWAHVLILTSRTEGLPGAVLEGSAAGLAVVAIDVGGVREAVNDGESGFVTSRDQAEIVERLRTLDEDRELIAKMGEAGRRHIARNFLIDDIVERYRSALRDRVR